MRNGVHGELAIGDFARASGLSVSSLRFYADSGVLVPARVDPWTGYRYYASGQVPSARLIAQLRALGVPPALMREILHEASSDRRRSLLTAHWRQLATAHRRRQAAFSAARTLLDHEEVQMPTTCTVDSDQLARALAQVTPAAGPIGKDDHQLPACVLFEMRSDGLRLAATDGHRLAVRDLPCATTGEATAVVALEELAGLPPATATKTVEVALDSQTVTVSGRTLRSIGSYYPDYGRFLAQREPAGLRVALNPAYLAAALEAAGPAGEVVLEIAGPLEPVVLRPLHDESFTAVVMPIRIKEPAHA